MRNHQKQPIGSRQRRIAARLMAVGLLLPLGACASDGWLASLGFDGGSADADAQISATSLMRVAEVTASQGEFATAAGLYSRAHELAPDDVLPLLALGDTLRRMGAPASAADSYRAVLALEPRNLAALRGLGAVLIEIDQPELAIAQLELALDVAPDHRLYNSLGVAHDMLGDHSAAQVYYREGFELAPNNLQIANNYGLSLALVGDHSAAIAMLERAVQDPAATPRVRQNLALAYGLAGERAAAERIAGLDLDQAAVDNNLSYYELLRRTGDSSMTAHALGTHTSEGGS
jgi:Flp pilus assembly protein TadD